MESGTNQLFKKILFSNIFRSIKIMFILAKWRSNIAIISGSIPLGFAMQITMESQIFKYLMILKEFLVPNLRLWLPQKNMISIFIDVNSSHKKISEFHN